jgi:hypothetical protein
MAAISMPLLSEELNGTLLADSMKGFGGNGDGVLVGESGAPSYLRLLQFNPTSPCIESM